MPELSRWELGHVGLYVTDIERMRDFYTRLLGFTVMDAGEPGGGRHLAFLSNKVDGIDSVDHGNAWSVYFLGPEGNRIEFFCDTPRYTAYPHRVLLDFSLSDREI